ncbi:MAG: methyltransferase [Mucinivorans sp.]
MDYPASKQSFSFKHFVVRQSQSAMKVGTDGVMLGAWAGVEQRPNRILDVGTGTGLVALMLAQRCPWAERIDAVEIEPQAACEARCNMESSPWAAHLNIFNESFQLFAQRGQQKYDLIVSNPPYFNGTYKSPAVERTAARHVELLGTDDLIEGVGRVIEPASGRFVAIFPYENGAVFIAKAALCGLYCNRILNIYSKVGGHIKRIILEFSTARMALIEQSIAIMDENGFTEQYRALTKEFYLKF